MRDFNEYPEVLTQNRERIEASFIFSLWKSPLLFDDYRKINIGEDKTIVTEDGKFYYTLGKAMFEQGFQTFDDITITTFLKKYKEIEQKFQELGGLNTIHEMMSLVSTDNIEGYYDSLVKENILLALYDKGFNVIENLEKFKSMTASDVYDYFDYQLNSISIDSSINFEIEDLMIDDEFIAECDSGIARGLNYGKNCPILNSITMGLPLGELFMIGGYSGVGKSSFVFENIIVPLSDNDIKCAIISNEQRSKDFKFLLLEHVLTQKLGYWKLTRKKLKQGGFTEEQKEKILEAREVMKTDYSHIKFVKLFDNDMGKVLKVIKKLSKLGYQAFMFDTMKSEDEINEAMWQQLLIHSRKLFQLASKENVSIICTYQLALHTLNRRFLDASCLSNAKQIKEVFSEMIYLRTMWDDEFEGESYYIEPYKLEKKNGVYTGVELPQTLDNKKKYIVAFIDKTRNDEGQQQILYEFNGRFNNWTEVGHCKVVNRHNW